MPRQLPQFARRMVIPLILVVLLAACGQANDEPAPAEAAEALGDVLSAAELVGTNWRAVAFGTPGNSKPVDEATNLTLSIGVERYAGSGGCNWFLGVYAVEGEQIAFRSPAETAQLCTDPPGIMEQEATYLLALQNLVAYRQLEEKLLGYTSDNQLLLTFVPADPVAFEGTAWSLKFLEENEAMAPVIMGTSISATFASGRLSGSAGCNTYEAAYTLEGEALTITDLTTTEVACETPDGVMAQEVMYLGNLASAKKLIQSSGLLQLLDAADQTILAFGAP